MVALDSSPTWRHQKETNISECTDIRDKNGDFEEGIMERCALQRISKVL
tara:strand:- start:812 stop:958 length:147 start_codon:yes stop_codon:yes gene_type:complete